MSDNPLEQALERLITAVEWEAYPIVDGIDVERRAGILLDCAQDAREALVAFRQNNH